MTVPERRFARRWAMVAAMTWRASPARCLLIILTFAMDIVALPLLAYMLRQFTNELLHGDHNAALRSGLVAAVAWAVSDQIVGVRNLLRNDLRERVGMQLNERRLELICGLHGIAHLEDPDVLNKIHIGENGQQVADVVCAAAETIANVLAVVATLVVLAAVSPWLMLTLPLTVPTLWLHRRGQRGVRRALDQAAESQRLADQLLQSLLASDLAAEIRITGAGHWLLDEYDRRWTAATRLIIRAKARAAGWLAVGWIAFLLGFATGLLFVVRNIKYGHGTPGDVVFMLAIARQQQQLLQDAVLRFRGMLEGIQVADAYFWLEEHTVTSPALPSKASGSLPRRLTTGIDLRRVSFGYPGTDRQVLQDINVRLPAGRMVALVGPHGSGKTSLVKVLTQMYAPSSGHITIDGRELSTLPPDTWRSGLTAAFQDFARFQTSAGECIGIGNLDHASDLVHLQEAVDRGDAQAVIDGLPDGLDTVLGTVFGGIDLSGGQWQRLALARCCMRQHPLLLVLDEPTSSLDPESEYRVFERHVDLARVMGASHGTITLVVSHRFSTVRMADEIIVLDGGTIVEHGNHDTLMERGGMYARMFEMQRRAYADVTSADSQALS